MSREQYVPQIPYGTRDFLPKEANQKRTVESALARLFAKWGYDEVVTPTFEYLETITSGAGCDISANMFKFFDKNNHIMALRPDMTTPMARVAATRLRENPLPHRLFYMTNVFRHEQAQAGRQCEFYQAGVELLGAADPAADAEVVVLGVESLLQAGLKNFQIGLGQVDFINGIMAQSRLTLEERHQVKNFMVNRDLVGLGEILTASGLSSAEQGLIREIPLLHGGKKVLSDAYRLVNNDLSRQALDNLTAIGELLVSYKMEQYVNFDLGLIRDFDYYTGMVFEAYTAGLGFPLCGGGRYDNMAAAFGVDCPATGFALGIERILLALERQGIVLPEAPKQVYVAWTGGQLGEAISQASKIRATGDTAELALQPQSREVAASQQKAKGYMRLLYCGEEDDQ
jgi:ATP phosphoribosyltransferase regulatory subunit